MEFRIRDLHSNVGIKYSNINKQPRKKEKKDCKCDPIIIIIIIIIIIMTGPVVRLFLPSSPGVHGTFCFSI